MKKKIGALLGLMAAAGLVWAEDLTFVTTLSSPMGTFAQLEAVDPSIITVAPLVNFCNTRAPAGAVAVKGANAYLRTLLLKNGTSLGGGVAEYRVESALNAAAGAELTGGRLLASAVGVSGASSAKNKVDETLYVSGMKVKGARTPALVIANRVQTSGAGSNEDLHWSNVYNKDYKCANGACSETGNSSYTSYLLTSVQAPEPDTYVHEPYLKTVKAAKVCGSVSYVTLDGYGSSKTGDQEANAHYYYADNITQTSNFKTQSCSMCQWGKPRVMWGGDVKKSDTSYINPYNGISNCPSGYTNAQLCQNNCNPAVKSCSFMCVKTPANISGCGNELIQRHCFCPCGTRPGEAACMWSYQNAACSGSGSPAWGAVCNQTDYKYEPKLGGTGQILGCRAAS